MPTPYEHTQRSSFLFLINCVVALVPIALLVTRSATRHTAVVNAAHADGVDVLVAAVLADPLLPAPPPRRG